ncbi:MAG: PH domain-containing protein [Woeseiaceae bacterium]|jgi:membrane protein YdbS with pleckstrin-like domain|nr:PH domain-containing protein [Woeseiaceae bacterium]
MFENVEIPLDELPGAATLDWQPLDRAYRSRLLVDRVITIALVVAGAVILSVLPKVQTAPILILAAVLAVVAVPILAWPFAAVPRMGFVVRDRDIVYRKGVLWRSVTAVPFNRIQHVETSNSPLDRRFGLSSLKIFTAGGSGSDLKIDGIAAERAEQLRALVLQKAGASIESDD